MIFIKEITHFNRPIKSYINTLNYESAEYNVKLELYDTDFNKSYKMRLHEFIHKYYRQTEEFNMNGAYNYYRLKRDMPVYGFSINHNNDLSCFTCDSMLKKGLFDKFDFKITELEGESPAQAIDIDGVDIDTGVFEKCHHALTLFVDLYVNDKFLVLPTRDGYHYYVKNNGHYFDVKITPKEGVNIDNAITKLITLSSISNYFQAS